MKVGIIQICSALDPKVNLKKIGAFLDEAKTLNLEAVFLPEYFYSMSDGTGPTPYLVEAENDHYDNIKELAKKYGIALLGGSAPTVKLNDSKVYNRMYNFDGEGNDLGSYDKINVFACDVVRNGKRVKIDEGKVYACGNTPKILEYGPLKIGLSLCFDLRYPEMFREYRKQGANAFTISAAFTVPTGKAHWETLVRARAIENQCFVFAAGQWGEHNEKISTYGHSLIVDPWGEVLADAGEGEKLIWADLDIDRIDEVRNSIVLFK